MKRDNLKYKEAWDNKLRKMVKPEDISKSEMHDRNRYFSEQFSDNEDKGKVLTLHRESKTFLSKNGKEVKRKSHFSAIADNTKEYREQTTKKLIRQESLVHKLSKEVLKEVKFIKIPELKIDIVGFEQSLFTEQYIKVLRVVSVEKKDTTSGRIPDAVIEVEMFGKVQLINIEFFYRHAIDEFKRKDYEVAEFNCLEIDISYLQDNLDDSEKSLKSKIKREIEENAYWISNKLQMIIEHQIKKQYYLEISTKTILRETEYYKNKVYNSEDEKFKERAYLWRDTLENIGARKENPCHHTKIDILKGDEKFTNIGKCKTCKNCLDLHNYTSEDINDIKCFCSNMDITKESLIKLKDRIIADGLNQI